MDHVTSDRYCLPENRGHVNLSKADIARFWRTVHKPEGNGCWEWKNKPGKFKYCYFWKVIGPRKNKGYFAHRIAFFLDRGYLPEGLEVCHTCDNCRCVRPDHLFSGTRRDNARDMARKGRGLLGDKNPTRIYPERVERGIQRYNAKLTDDLIREIRRLYAAGGISFVRLGAQFGIGGPTAFKIVRRKMWDHVI
jgi:hypothetical protein